MNALRRILLAGFVTASLAPAESPQAEDAEPQVAPEAAAVHAPLAATAHGRERLDLDTSVVTGNRELPKVMYIVPWKQAQLGELPGQPFNTLLDEVMTPLDRDEFRREVRYFEAVSTAEPTKPNPP